MQIGVIGTGSIALRHRQNIKQVFPKAKVIAAPSRETSASLILGSVDVTVRTVDELIAQQPDFVIIASPASLHATQARPLIAAKVPLLIEKPMVISVEEGKELVYLLAESEVPVAIGYCLRYMPSARIMKQLLEQSKIGSIYNGIVNTGQYLPDWRSIDYRKSVSSQHHLGGGVLLELSHEFDYLQWLLGPLDIKHAMLRQSSELETDVEELADVMLVSKQGCVCTVHLDFLQKKAFRMCTLIGSEGSLEWDLITNSIYCHSSVSSELIYENAKWDTNEMYIDMLEDFINLIEGRANHCVLVEQALNTNRLVDDIKSGYELL